VRDQMVLEGVGVCDSARQRCVAVRVVRVRG
jgi:hypothetical protein